MTKKKLVAPLIILLSVVSLAPCISVKSKIGSSAQEPFDRWYGRISWTDEKARLDNFAIQLSHEPNYVGHIYVFPTPDACVGEAQARAVRAQRYLVEHRGVAWNRVAWTVEGYREDFTTIILLGKPGEVAAFGVIGSTPSSVKVPGKRVCKARIAQIQNSKW